MAKCAQCNKREAIPGSNLCPKCDLDGRDILYLKQDVDAPDPGSV